MQNKTSNHNRNGNHGRRSRFGGYLSKEEQAPFEEEIDRITKLERLNDRLSRGELLRRVGLMMQHGLRCNQTSIDKFIRDHKRSRQTPRQTPART